ncbi:winged helix-turn-helix transcriptional regulator [Streptomyces acidiscabies]|uniref:Helix-turn-helix domain-containing protein n=1 Tax=Streptomyces acidiscabies TaxID=42234 RepID=A0AAP6BG32_9ACTN|nr:helix-turn-helix domain-containing protein [Streptomyces acidiscabies]MBP5941022.1 helix-turn-helix transcriptional regulator [Streptomyces sp. LBUM 1476]MBZ3912333.1 helix-turn-helix transcriptional regulator [Streptomyces acidiscabies]MDX2964108.1 helix-turn-helix domain-containing protein [Streptomyces acidiscabies]MDX3021707.1 helix-turn-helix domain-containing protein [Streptomyces acidiscabies]MDX3795080.1 helix-turn-helix domain-containing protein [Streptomyces acidiscabies]
MPAPKDPRPCSIADALSLVGEKYTLLIIREVLLGNGRFDQLARNIGAPRDVLSSRLRRLVDEGILTKHTYSDRPRRHEYHPTRAGLDLGPILLTLMAWGDHHLRHDTNRPMVVEHTCGHELLPAVTCRECGVKVTEADMTHHSESPGWTVAGPVA